MDSWKSSVDQGLWQRILEAASAELDTPVVTLDGIGVALFSSGKMKCISPPYLSGSCSCGKRFITAPIMNGPIRGMLFAHPTPDSDEKKTAAIQSVLNILSTILPESCRKRSAGAIAPAAARLQELIRAGATVSEILSTAVPFIASEFRAENVSLRFTEHRAEKSLFSLSPALRAVEDFLLTALQSSKAMHLILDISSDYLLAGIRRNYPALDQTPVSILAQPLIRQKQVAGMVCLYAQKKRPWYNQELDALESIAQALLKVLTNADILEEAEVKAVTDKLTGLYNRRHFSESFTSMIMNCRKENIPVSLIIFDIDNFKKLNDTYGHPAGDTVLATIGEIVRGTIRKTDVGCRFGGEEFAIMIPQIGHDAAYTMAERLRKAVEETRFSVPAPVTISIGLVTCKNASLSENEMVKEADANLYRAKNTGKNKTMQSIVLDRTLSPICPQEVEEFHRGK